MNITIDKDGNIEKIEDVVEFLQTIWPTAHGVVVNSFSTKEPEGSIRFTARSRFVLLRNNLRKLADLLFFFEGKEMVLSDIEQKEFNERAAGPIVEVTIWFSLSRND